MAETEAKYHHLIPQTYMSAWANGSGTLKVEFKNNPGVITERNKERIAGITDFHSIRAGMPLCTEDDAKTIFSSVLGYTVECNGEKLAGPLDLNKHYYEFDKWIITRLDGSVVSKRQIKHTIDQVKIRDIEANWSTKYENSWNQEVKKIESSVLHAPNGSLKAFDREYLMRFYTALDWRGFSSNREFEDLYQKLTGGVLDQVEIPESERILPSLSTASDEIRHCLLLQYYRKYLDDTGVIFEDANANLAHTNFHFLVSDGSAKFNTCDSPVFIHTRKDGQLVGLLPITPRIMMAKGRCTDENELFYITHITDAAVEQYNEAIWNSAEEFIILPNCT